MKREASTRANKYIKKHLSPETFVKKEREAAGKPPLKEELAKLNPPLTLEQEERLPIYIYDLLTFDKKIVNEKWAKELSTKLVIWVNETEDAIKIGEFLQKEKVYWEDFNNLKKRFPFLEMACKYANNILGNKRERNILEEKWNATAGMYMMNKYDEDWKQETERRDSIKLKQSQATFTDLKGILEVVAAQTPHTEEVAEALKTKNPKLGVCDGDSEGTYAASGTAISSKGKV